jgi:hypothetical protein
MTQQNKDMFAGQVQKIEHAIADWEEAVSWIERGWDSEDEYINDIAARHVVFQLLERCSNNLPSSLQERLDTADGLFRAATVDDWSFSGSAELDRVQNWYFFRRPEVVSLRNAWESDSEFRQLIMASIPGSK